MSFNAKAKIKEFFNDIAEIYKFSRDEQVALRAFPFALLHTAKLDARDQFTAKAADPKRGFFAKKAYKVAAALTHIPTPPVGF